VVEAVLVSCSAFRPLINDTLTPKAEIIVAERSLSIAAVIVLQHDAFDAKVQDAFGFGVTPGASYSELAGIRVSRFGRAYYLFSCEHPHFIDRVTRELGKSAAVTDQSSSLAVIRLSGNNVHKVLSVGASLDFHPDSFRPGSVAATRCAALAVYIWRLPDQGGKPVFEIAVARSVVESFWHWLVESAAVHGGVSAPDPGV